MPTVDQIVERVRGGRLVGAALDLAEADVVDEQQVGACPSLEASRIGAISETGVEVVEQVDAAGVEHADPDLAGTHGEGLEDVALTSAVVAGDDQVVVPAHEVEPGQLEDEWLVEGGLKLPLKALERFALGQAAGGDAPGDALLELVRDLDAEDVLEELRGAGALLGRPGEPLVELGERERQPEELEVVSESGEDGIVAGGVDSGSGFGAVGSIGWSWHAGDSW
jgi:hypothetical protein